MRLLAVLVARFVCIYFSLLCLLMFIGIFISPVPLLGEFIGKLVDTADSNSATWTAVHVFHLTGPVTLPHPTGSGDTTLAWVQLFIMLLLAAVLILPWSLVAPLRRADGAVYPWVKLLVRLVLSYFLLSYGFAKIYPNQFPGPDLSRLMETYGESSPMGLLWTFMGASTPYQIFCGSLEAVSGLLILFRRTSTVGALLAATVMFNIALLNFCFDVPVKIFSSQLFFMCLFLLWDDLKPLWQFFILRRATKLEGACIPPFEAKWLHYARTAVQILVPLFFLWQIVPDERTRYNAALVPKVEFQPLRGIWEADASTLVWKKVVLDSGRRIAVWTNENQLLRFVLKADAAKHSFKLTGWRNDHTGEFLYQLPDSQHLTLTGKIDQQPVELKMHKVSSPTFLLTTRGFHWISEDPYNY